MNPFPECYIYSDSSCKMQCSYPYIPRNQTLAAYCDFRCASNQYLYPDGSCLSTCQAPAIKSQNLTNEWYCKGPCEDKFYYPDQKVCLTSCSENYDEDYSLFYKRCLLTKVSETIKSTIEVTNKAGTASRAITQVTTALSSGSPTGISTSVAGKIFSNIKYFNITYSVGLQEALLTWKSNFINLEFMPDMPESIQNNIVSQPVPYMFEKYSIQSSFLWNFWNNLLLLVFLTLLFVSIKVIEYLIKLKTYQEKVIIFRAMVQNFLISQLYSVYGDILFYSTIEYRSMDIHKGLTGLSFAFAILLTLIIISSLVLHFFFLQKYQRIKKTQSNPEVLEKFIKSNEGNFVLFRDFKDRLLIQQSFLLLLTARDLAFSLLITTLFHHPLAQSIIILILNLLMIAYLILRNPFVSLFDYIQQFFYEFITLTVSVNVLILAIMDGIDSTGKELRTKIGNFIIITNLCFNFGALAFMLVKGWFVVKEIYENYKAKRQLNKNPKIKHQRPESRGPGPFLKESPFNFSEKTHQNGSLIKNLNESQTPLNIQEAEKKEESSNIIIEEEILKVEDLEVSSPDLQQSQWNLKTSLHRPALNRHPSGPETELSNNESIDNNDRMGILKGLNPSSDG